MYQEVQVVFNQDIPRLSLCSCAKSVSQCNAILEGQQRIIKNFFNTKGLGTNICLAWLAWLAGSQWRPLPRETLTVQLQGMQYDRNNEWSYDHTLKNYLVSYTEICSFVFVWLFVVAQGSHRNTDFFAFFVLLFCWMVRMFSVLNGNNIFQFFFLVYPMGQQPLVLI